MAEVSGPGKFSERTDKAVSAAGKTLPDAGYGEQKAYQEQQAGAPKGESPGGEADFAALFGNPADRVVGMGEPTSMPGVPVTDGAAMGAGAGVEALGLQDQAKADLEGLAPYLPVLEFMANQPGASWAMRNVVRKVKALQ